MRQETVSALFALIGFAAFAARRLVTYLHIFQQEEYDGPRFLRWLSRERAFDRRLSLALVALSVVELILSGLAPHWSLLRSLHWLALLQDSEKAGRL